jgi:hypothetical protein
MAMSELLDMANVLFESSGQEPHGKWFCFGKYPCMYHDDALFVIKGYQDLLRRVVSAHYECAPSGLSSTFIAEIESSIPEHP